MAAAARAAADVPEASWALRAFDALVAASIIKLEAELLAVKLLHQALLEGLAATTFALTLALGLATSTLTPLQLGSQVTVLRLEVLNPPRGLSVPLSH